MSTSRFLAGMKGNFLKYRFICGSINRLKYSSITGNARADRALQTVTGGKVDGWLTSYEKAVGLTEVREAQLKVIKAESDFLQVQDSRRHKQSQIAEVQTQLRALSAEIEKTHRGEERYLSLLTEEHKVIKDENLLKGELGSIEQDERAKFGVLSWAVRDSHEKERARSERTKYWSIIGSIIGATIGIIGTSINNYLRMRELRGLVKDSSDGGIELRGLVHQLSEAMNTQHKQVHSFVSDLKSMVSPSKADKLDQTIHLLPLHAYDRDSSSQLIQDDAGSDDEQSSKSDVDSQDLEKQAQNIMSLMQEQEKRLHAEMTSIKDILAVSKAVDSDGNVVYVGPELQSMLDQTEKNLETKLKMNALWTVCFIYGGLALTIPVLFNLFR